MGMVGEKVKWGVRGREGKEGVMKEEFGGFGEE